MHALRNFLICIFFTSMLVTSCSVQEITPPPPQAPPSPAVITSGIQGGQATSAIAQARELVLTSTELYKNLADIGLSRMTTPVPATPTSVACTDGGTYSHSGTYTAPNYALTLTFNGCREGGYQYVGTYTLNGTPTNLTINLGSGSATFNIFNFNPSYTVLLAYLKASLSFTMTSAGTLPNTACTITSIGSINTFDYFLLDTYAMTFSGLKTDYTQTTNANLDEATSITTNGTFSETWAARTKTSRIAFTDFKVDKVRLNAATAPSVNYTADDTSMNGRLAFYFTPPSFGFSGIFDVVTQTPIHYVYGPPKTTNAGTMVVNGAATAQYSAGGGVDITVTGDPTTLAYTDEYTMMKVSDYAAMEQDKPPLIAPPTIPGTPITLPTGSTMAVTLTWTGPAPTYTSTSDMDLHLKYFVATAPTGTAPTWHLDWHQGKVYPGSSGSCTDPVGIPFSDAFDLDAGHAGTCDVGLDFDTTTGYGPEHITDLKLLSGYYVISVNSFALPPAENPTKLYSSLHIGDKIFGPYIVNNVTASDSEGTNPLAWFRIADVRMNADGTVDVLVPDPAITPWGH
jgi:hypothetical protein